MKKSYRPTSDKNKDRVRLKALTRNTFGDMWSYDGRTLPEHVCRYLLGVYYEIDISKKIVKIEYYQEGGCVDKYYVDIKG